MVVADDLPQIPEELLARARRWSELKRWERRELERERIGFWATVTGIGEEQFRKTYVKQEGTGHRKNRLYHGTITIRVLGKGDELQKVLGWIDGLSDLWGTASMRRSGR